MAAEGSPHALGLLLVGATSDVGRMTELLDRGADIEVVDGSFTALIRASFLNQLPAVKLLVARGANLEATNVGVKMTALHWAGYFGRLDVCLFLLTKGANLLAVSASGRTVLSEYGAGTTLTPETKAAHCADLQAAWLAGPQPSQVKRRNWERRAALMQVTAENRYRPLSHVVAAMPPVDPTAAIPPILLDTAERRHAHLLSQVLSNEGIHRLIVSML